MYILAIHKIDIGDRDIRQIILDRTKGQADILTIDYHCNNVDKENSHLALLGLLKHILNGKSLYNNNYDKPAKFITKSFATW